MFVVNGVMGVEVTTERLWERADELGLARLIFVNMLDRERADFFRTLESLKAGLRPARRGHRDPDRRRARAPGRDRPRGHEGVQLRRRRPRQLPRRSRSRRSSRRRPQEYREKLMDEVAEDSDDADGALPRGRGDLARGDRRRAQDRRHRRRACSRSPAAWPRATSASTGCSTRFVEDLPSPAKKGAVERRRHDARAGRGQRHGRVRVQDARRPVRRAASTCSASTRAWSRPTPRCTTAART